jgi:NADPH:quinone reductase-like Zn-dependent oxidoreductase
MLPDDIMGHEMMGEVVEVGSGVNGKLKKGDRVVLRQPWCAFWITIKLNKVFIMFCDPVCQISGSARSEVCIRDDLLAFDREARFPIRPN